MIAKCTQCHHEWQAVKSPGNCDWCGAPGKMISTDYIEDGPSYEDLATHLDNVYDGVHGPTEPEE
jgi:hypothetical protein